MAFLYLVNCMLLTFAPLFLLFNTSSVHEYGFRICSQGLLGYIAATCTKLLLIATVLVDLGEWNIITEILKEGFNLLDMYVFYVLFTRKGPRADKRAKILGAGLGWAVAEMIFSHALVFIFNASGGEFSWEYLQRAVLANCRIIQIISVSCFMWIRTEKTGLTRLVASVFVVGILCVVPFLFGSFKDMGVNQWVLCGGEVGLSLIVALITKLAAELSIN